LIAELAPETERRSKQRQKMNQEAKLPKSQREFNFHNLMLKKQQEQLVELEHQVMNSEQKLEESNLRLNIIRGELMMLEDKQREVKKEHVVLSNQVQELRAEKQTLLMTLRTFNDELLSKLAVFCSNFFMSVHTNDLGYQDKARRFLEQTINTLWDLPEPLRIKAKALVNHLSSQSKDSCHERSKQNTNER
jgi:chromosome segregation ATPase